jgi:mRNA (2'-O-methyladenosine-N6-)-methyltransferase
VYVVLPMLCRSCVLFVGDVRTFDFRVLGTFPVIMADPPWDIRMSLPYSTIRDPEMLALNIAVLQQEGGVIFLWVTHRALDFGRECLHK